jgi:3-oxoacyl-[acyl-carrier protein] reductase
MDLRGKTAVITGGSRGIGKAIALKLASLGSNVVINYTSSPDKAQEVVSEIIAMGVQSIAIKADVSNFTDVDNFIKESFQTFGSIDILVNNAGITKDNLLMRMEEADWDSVMAVNLKGTFNCTKAVSRIMMKQRSGKIINVASVVGVMGNAGQSNYSASKAGIIGFTKSIAKELASRNINVNAIAPGFISTDMTGVLKEEVKEMFLTGIPLKREGKPEDVANVVAFLSSNLSDYITGQVINIDGGMVM